MDTDRVDLSQVRKKYGGLTLADQISADSWHAYSDRAIEKIVQSFFSAGRLNPDARILNAGSAGRDYGVAPQRQTHLDLASQNISSSRQPVIGSIESLPFLGATFDCCLCLGSVINFNDAALAISELSRVIRPGGLLALEFESSNAFHFLGEPAYAKNAYLTEAFSVGGPDILWVYSECYLRGILGANSFQIVLQERFHILTSLGYKILGSAEFAARLACLDPPARLLPLLSRCSANIILFCQKIS